MRIQRASIDWLFIIGLILPAAYVSLFPGAYFSIWSRIIASIGIGGATMTIFYAGVIKTLLYFSKLLRGEENPALSDRIVEVILVIHVGIPTVILLMIISATISHTTAIEPILRALFAFVITEFVLFPVMGLLYLRDKIRHGRGDLATMFVVSVALYACISLLTASNLIGVDYLNVSIGKLSALEAAGARLLLLLLSLIALAGSPLFWLSTSLYSVDTAPPPIWISAVYVLILPLFLYYRNHHDFDPVAKAMRLDTPLPADAVRIVATVLVATVLTFLAASAADFLIPHNMTGKVLQLFGILIIALITLKLTTREALQQ